MCLKVLPVKDWCWLYNESGESAARRKFRAEAEGSGYRRRSQHRRGFWWILGGCGFLRRGQAQDWRAKKEKGEKFCRVPDPGWVKKIRIRIRDEQPGSYFGELRNNFFGVKILKFFDADPGSGIEKIRIRDENPGSATMQFCIFRPMMRISDVTVFESKSFPIFQWNKLACRTLYMILHSNLCR